MSSFSDSSDASADDVSTADELPVFRELTKERAKSRRKRRDYGGFGGLKFFDLNEKQKQRERETLREELKDVIAEQAEIENYQIQTEPFTFRTRESSISPHTPPGRPSWEEAPLQDTLHDVSLPGTSTGATVCERPVKARRLVYRYTDSSSSDDEDFAPTQRRALRNWGSPPPSVDADIAAAGGAAGGWDTSDTDGGGGVNLKLPEVKKEARALSLSDSKHGFQEPGGNAEPEPSTSLTKADFRRKRRTERERSRFKTWSNRRSSSTESSSSREAGREGRLPLPAPKSRASGDAGLLRLSAIYRDPSSHRIHGRTSPAASHSGAVDGHSEDPVGQLAIQASHQRDSVPLLSSLRSGSGTSRAARPSSAGSAFLVWHSTPVVGRPRTAPSPAGSGAVPGSSRLMFAADVDHLLAGKGQRRALDRGDVLVELTIAQQGQRESTAAHVTDQRDATPRPGGTSGSLEQRDRPQSGAASSGSSGPGTGHRSIVVRFGLGWSRERVLVSDAASATSAIASVCSDQEPPQQQQQQPLNVSGAHPYDLDPEDMLNQLLKLCGQERPIAFDEALRLGQGPPPAVIRKIGEGSAGEVYLVRRGASRKDESVLKVIPVGGNQVVDGCKPQSLAGASAELVIARELSNLRFNATNRTANFIGLKSAHCVHGPYHAALLASWKEYEERLCSQNENPEVFSDEQLYLILDFEYGGKPLEDFKGSAEQLKSVFVQVSCSLAAAESALRFEHRDLHCDNVLVRRTGEEHATYALRGAEVRVPTAGVWASLIDYTLSRISKGRKAEYASSEATTETVLFTDLALDSQLFRGSGSYQYDVYRLMRECNGGDWKAYEPFTNVLWLNYVARKLLAKRPRCPPGGGPVPLCSRLAEWEDALLSFPSAGAFVSGCLLPVPAKRKRRREPAPGHHAMALRRK